MNKLKETNLMIDYINKLLDADFSIDNNMLVAPALLDIAKSLAMITDKLCETDDKWIPTSERLPSIGGGNISDEVLITDGDDIIYMGYLEEKKGKIFWHYSESDDEIDVEDDVFIAWMPLPKPYKAESEDKT